MDEGEADNDLRLHRGDLRFQPGPAGGALARVRLGMDLPSVNQVVRFSKRFDG